MSNHPGFFCTACSKTWKARVKSPPTTHQYAFFYKPDAFPVAKPKWRSIWWQIKFYIVLCGPRRMVETRCLN